jgi:uncharacterized membrane protein
MSDATSPGVPPPPGVPPLPGPSSNRGLMIVLSYLWLLALVPLLVEKEDKEVQWHAKHGIVLTVAEVVLWIALMIVNVVLSTVFWGFGCLLGILWFALGIGILIVHVMCIVKGVNGQRFLIPGVSEYANRF